MILRPYNYICYVCFGKVPSSMLEKNMHKQFNEYRIYSINSTGFLTFHFCPVEIYWKQYGIFVYAKGEWSKCRRISGIRELRTGKLQCVLSHNRMHVWHLAAAPDRDSRQVCCFMCVSVLTNCA